MTRNQLRESQIITTYGPGSLVDLPEASIMIAGLDQWEYEADNIPALEEPRLTEKLRRLLDVPSLSLRKPPPSKDDPFGFHPNITGYRFPEWFIVQHAEEGPRHFRRRKLVHLTSLTNNKFRDEDNQNRSVVPVRFVRACRRGHIGDIDWKAFVHGAQTGCPRQLWIEERGTTGDLDEIWITCDCGANRVMSQAARRELRALGSCNGSRPWLGSAPKEKCAQENRLLIRSASNAYFPQLMSVISIPDRRGPVDEVVTSLWNDFLFEVHSLEDLTREKRRQTVADRLAGFDDNDVLQAIQRRHTNQPQLDRPVKVVEFEALSEARDELGSDVPEGNFFARKLSESLWQCDLMQPVKRIVLVHRLREVIALAGFTRFEAAGPDFQGELSLVVERAPLAVDANWLPAVENRGEGIFIQFHTEAIQKWLARAEVAARGVQLFTGFQKWLGDHATASLQFPGLPYYLLHSLSHLLLTSISLECGYPASALRERIYVGEHEYGLLIYTGSSDAEGTLGGLVLAGRDIKRYFSRALEMGMLCSNDPVCALHSPVDHDDEHLIGSACHGCLLISETSCEQSNNFLDRSLVVPTVEALGTNFFSINPL